MYLSRVTMNAANPAALRTLADPYAMHQLVLSALPDREQGGPGRVLYRVEPEVAGRAPQVLVQSEQQPDWQEPGRESLLTAECKTFSPRLKPGQRLRFRLRANPTARRVFERSDDGKQSGKRIGVYGEDNQRAWLDRKAEAGGFRVLDCSVLDRGFQVSRRRNGAPPLKHLWVDFEGILDVTDPDTFLSALESGIGSAKAFGFGLLSVAPA